MVLLVAMLVTGCNSVPQKQALLDQVEKDTKGVDRSSPDELGEVCQCADRSTSLPQPFRHDPADQIIMATALEENATVLTKDELLEHYSHVRTLW